MRPLGDGTRVIADEVVHDVENGRPYQNDEKGRKDEQHHGDGHDRRQATSLCLGSEHAVVPLLLGEDLERPRQWCAVFLGLDQGVDERQNGWKRDALCKVFERGAPFGEKTQLECGVAQLLRKDRVAARRFCHDALHGGIRRKPRLGADDKHVERVGKLFLDGGQAFVAHVAKQDVGQHAAGQRGHHHRAEIHHRTAPDRVETVDVERRARQHCQRCHHLQKGIYDKRIVTPVARAHKQGACFLKLPILHDRNATGRSAHQVENVLVKRAGSMRSVGAACRGGTLSGRGGKPVPALALFEQQQHDQHDDDRHDAGAGRKDEFDW